MMHPDRCGNKCRFFVAGSTYLCGGCNHNGIILVMKADARQWIDIVGCASYVPPESGIIDADTRSEGEIESDAREAAGDRKYHEMREGMD